MSMRLDEFESVFRSAIKPTYTLRRPPLADVVLLADVPAAGLDALSAAARTVIADAATDAPSRWRVIEADRDLGLQELLTDLRGRPLDLLITHRHVLSHWRNTPHAIGSALAVLAQSLQVPILMLPSPDTPELLPRKPPARALVTTRRLTDDSDLVDWALHLTGDDGTVVLAHVEDSGLCGRYLDAIGRIQGIHTELARQKLPEKLLQLSRDYIASVMSQMREHGVRETLHSEVRLGDPMTEFAMMIERHQVELLVGAALEQSSQVSVGAPSHRPPVNGRTFALAAEFSHVPVLFV